MVIMTMTTPDIVIIIITHDDDRIKLS